MIMELVHDDRVLEIETERIEVSTNLPQPDPRWAYTDNALHHHRAEREAKNRRVRYPTLVRRESEPYWCDDCRDEHTDTWFECPLCGEKIKPGTFIDPSPRYINGLTSYLLSGEPIPAEEGEALFTEFMAVTEEQIRRVVGRLVRDEEESQ